MTKATGISVGLVSFVLGVGEAAAGDGSIITPINILSGGTLLVVVWVGNRISKVAENFFDSQAAKLIALPTAEVIAKDKQSLFEKLERFAAAADDERHAMSEFREKLADRLADYGARIKSLEDAGKR